MLRESLALVVRKIMEAEVAEQIGAAARERRGSGIDVVQPGQRGAG